MKDKLIVFFRRNRGAWCAGVVLTLLCCAAFLPALKYETSPFDDGLYVGNTYLLRISVSNFLYHLTHPVLKLYSPLVMYSLSVDQLLWGTELMRVGVRLHNLLLHIISSILLYLICRDLRFRGEGWTRVRPGFWAALTAAAAFAIHPQRVESVIWVAERKDCLVLALGMGAIYAFLKAARRNRVSVFSIALFVLSFGAKPLMIGLPVILFAALFSQDQALRWKRHFRLLWPYFLVSTLYFLANLRQIGEFTAGAVGDSYYGARWEIALVNFGGYFFRTLMPWRLSPLYPLYVHGSGTWIILLMGAVCATVLFFSVYPGRFSREFRFGWLVLLFCYLTAIFPMVGFRAVGNADFADRYSYFPSIFIWIAAAFALQYVSNRFYRFRRLPQLLFVPVCVIMLCNTWNYLKVWRSRDALFRRILNGEERPNPTAFAPAISHALSHGKPQEALELVDFYRQEYGSIAPGRQEGADNFAAAIYGLVAYQRGNRELALRYFDRALSSPVWGCLVYQSYDIAQKVLLLAAQEHLARRHGHPEELLKAVTLFGMASNVTMGYDPAAAWNYRGISQMLSENYVEAEKSMRRACKSNPADPHLQYNLHRIREMRRQKMMQP